MKGFRLRHAHLVSHWTVHEKKKGAEVPRALCPLLSIF